MKPITSEGSQTNLLQEEQEQEQATRLGGSMQGHVPNDTAPTSPAWRSDGGGGGRRASAKGLPTPPTPPKPVLGWLIKCSQVAREPRLNGRKS